MRFRAECEQTLGNIRYHIAESCGALRRQLNRAFAEKSAGHRVKANERADLRLYHLLTERIAGLGTCFEEEPGIQADGRGTGWRNARGIVGITAVNQLFEIAPAIAIAVMALRRIQSFGFLDVIGNSIAIRVECR